jgi:hypothetical protein
LSQLHLPRNLHVDFDGLILESLHHSICSVEIKHVSLRLQVTITG